MTWPTAAITQDIEVIIRRKYPGTSQQVIKLVIDMLLRNVAFFSSKVKVIDLITLSWL
jgi:hypothetical protein